MTFALIVLRIVLLLLLGSMATACAGVVPHPEDVHYANKSCTTCAGHFPRTGGHHHHP